MRPSIHSGRSKPYTPDEVKGAAAGVRPSVAKALALLDTADPLFPAVAVTLRDMAHSGTELDEQSVEIAIRLVRHRARTRDLGRELAADTRPLPAEAAEDEKSIVYYIRRGDLIKIGRTINPRRRLQGLLPDEILAFEPGGGRVETSRHRQFLHARKGTSEYFHPTSDLLEHIRGLRDQHGDPDPTWPTTANVGRDLEALASEIPPSLGLARAGEAAKAMNVKANTVYAWVRRGRLRPVDFDESGKPLYWLGDVWRLREQGAARRAS